MAYKPYKIPNRKKWLLTDDFLRTFKEELDKIFKVYEKESNPNYWNTYNYLESTGGFYEALKIACIKHNVKKAIYEYVCKLNIDDSDNFDFELTQLMCKRNIIEKGNIEDLLNNNIYNYIIDENEIEWYEKNIRHKDYYVIKKDWKFKNPEFNY